MIRTFIQISSLILTLEAAIFLAKSNLGLSAQAIAEISTTRQGYNSHLITSLARQQADTWVGVLFLLLAFLLQMVHALWPMRIGDFDAHWGATACAMVLWVVLGCGAHFYAGKAARNTALDVEQILKKPATPSVSAPEKTEGVTC